MSEIITEVRGRPNLFSLRSEERILIETAHGIIEVRADVVRSRAKQVRFSLVLPADLRFRKGDAKSTHLYMQYLTQINGRILPDYKLLAPQFEGEGFSLREPDVLAIS